MMDYEKIKAGVRLLLEGIGEDVNREGLLETPDRIARMCAEIYGGLYEDPAQHLQKQFTVERDDLVIGKAHIGYLPNGKVVGLSKLARTVDIYARRPQIQEKMTADIAKALEKHLNPKGVIVMVEAEHTCMTMRGIKKPGSKTVTLVATGVFEENMELQNRFLTMVRG